MLVLGAYVLRNMFGICFIIVILLFYRCKTILKTGIVFECVYIDTHIYMCKIDHVFNDLKYHLILLLVFDAYVLRKQGALFYPCYVIQYCN